MHHSCLCGSAKNLMFAKPSSQVVGENVFHVPLCRVFFIFNMLKTIWKPIYFIISNIYLISSQFNFNAIQDGIFCGCSRMAGGRGAKMPPPSPKLSHLSYNDEIWHSCTLPKGDPKKIWITWYTPSVLLVSATFHRKSANFAISRNIEIDCILIHSFYLF